MRTLRLRGRVRRPGAKLTTIALVALLASAAPLALATSASAPPPRANTTETWVLATITLLEDGSAEVDQEVVEVGGPGGPGTAHARRCFPIFAAPIGFWCGPTEHGTATIRQTMGFGWQVLPEPYEGTLRGYLGPGPFGLGGWVATCHIEGFSASCSASGSPAVGTAVDHFCTSSTPRTSVPGGSGVWNCLADEDTPVA